MTRGLNFSEAFWDSDITGTLGWDRLCKRMKDGRNVCGAVLQYVKDRAKAETEYSRALSNISRKVNGKEETGDLGMGWNQLKSQTERMASFHDEAAKHFNALAEELTKFNDDQKRTKAQTEDTVKRYIQSKRNEYQKVMSAKRTYESRCVDLDNADINLQTAKKSVSTKRSDLEKATRNQAKSKDNMVNADTSYKSAIQSLEAVRQKWEEQMEQGCSTFEDLEKKRIDCLRDLLWRCTNIDSMTCVGHDDCSERVRTTLEKCDVTQDIQDFIDSNTTGSARPVPVEYERYYKHQEQAGANKGHRPPIATPGRPPQFPPPARPLIHVDEGAYATVLPGNSCKVLLKVIRAHRAASPSELQVNVGDILELVKPKNKFDMVSVKYLDQNRIGVIPAYCVTKMP